MTLGKYFFFFSYLIIGFILLVSIPMMTPKSSSGVLNFIEKKTTALYVLKILCILGVCILIPFKLSLLIIIISLVIAFGLMHINRIEAAIYGMFTICISSFLPQWLYDDGNRLSLNWAQAVQFSFFTVFIYFLLVLDRGSIRVKPYLNQLIYITFSSLFLIAAFYLSFVTSIGYKLDSFYQWHHWGAYIGQAELVYSGVIPLKEIPLQYGLGPIALLAIGCNWGCWYSMYWVIGSVTITFFILLMLITKRLVSPKNSFNYIIALSALFVAVFFWPPFHGKLIPINTFPSLSALRFMPGVLMLWALIELSKKINKSSPNTGIFVKIIHILWVACFLWSPEAGIQASILWVPFYVFLHPSRSVHDTQYWNITKKLSILLGVFVSGIAVFVLIFYLFYGELPSLLEYLAIFKNLSHVNTFTKVNSNGPVWFFAICCSMLLVGLIIYKSFKWISFDEKTGLQNLWLIGLLCYANFTYVLSHPEDSVFHSLITYIVLLLIALANMDGKRKLQLMSKLLLASVLAWSTLIFGWSGLYKTIISDLTESPAAFFYDKPTSLIGSFIREKNNPFAINSRSRLDDLKSNNLNQALSYIHENYREPVEVYDQWWLISSDQKFLPWSGYHMLPNVEFMKPLDRQKYLYLSAKRLYKSGWVVFDKDFDTKGLLDDYQKIYRQKEIQDFGYYVGIRFVPK